MKFPRCHALIHNIVVAIMVCLAAGCGKAIPPNDEALPPATRPNVVLIVMDTLRADRIHAMRNGNAVMPFLARMATSGTHYRHAISPCSWTKPAMASILTGLYPQRHGVIYSARLEDPDNPTSDRLSESFTTLPESLHAAGYNTWGFQTNANLTAALGFAQGFRAQDYHFSNGAPAYQVTEATLKELPKLAEPFFVYAHFMDPHAPYRADPKFWDALGPLPDLPEYDQALLDDDERFMTYYSDQIKTALSLQAEPTVQALSAAGMAAVQHRYDLECHAMDRAMERLVEEIQRVHPNTLFVFLSDHGEEFWERGGMGHGTTLHQEQVHVPFILVGPNVPKAVIEDRISTLDLLPTLLDALQLPAVPSDGVSLRVSSDLRPVYSFSRGPWPALGVETYGVFQDGYSYLQDSRRNGASLFYLPDDSLEQDDLHAQKPEVSARFAAQLAEHLRSFGGGESGDAVPLDDGTREVLRALGYVDDL